MTEAFDPGPLFDVASEPGDGTWTLVLARDLRHAPALVWAALTEPGQPSPYRDRPVAENLDLFQRMKAGEFAPGARVLRARIDMGSSVLPMRDPILYRIVREPHHRTGDEWCI